MARPPWGWAAAGRDADGDSLLLDRIAVSHTICMTAGPWSRDEEVRFTDQLDDVGMVEVLHVGRLLQTLLDVSR